MGQDLTLQLQNYHQRMINNLALKEVDQNEKELTLFFNAFYSSEQLTSAQKTIIDEAALELIKQNLPKNQKLNNLFGRATGKSLERNISKIIKAVATAVTDMQLPNDMNFVEGGKSIASSRITKTLFDSFVKSASKKMQPELVSKAKNLQQYFLPQVQQKVDIDGGKYNITISETANPKLIHIFSLLSQCQFQAKNYDTLRWNSAQKSLTKWKGTNFLSFGNSNVRFFSNILSAQGASLQTVEDLYYYAIRNYQQNKEIKKIIWHFKTVYEITGMGAIDLNGNYLKQVNYIVFNEPSSKTVIVKSIKTLLNELLKDERGLPGNPFTAEVMVDKQLFKGIP